MRSAQSVAWRLLTGILDLLLYGILSRDEYTEQRASVSIAAARRQRIAKDADRHEAILLIDFVVKGFARPWVGLSAGCATLEVGFLALVLMAPHFPKRAVAWMNTHVFVTSAIMFLLLGFATGLVATVITPRQERGTVTVWSLLLFAALIVNNIQRHAFALTDLEFSLALSGASALAAVISVGVRKQLIEYRKQPSEKNTDDVLLDIAGSDGPGSEP